MRGRNDRGPQDHRLEHRHKFVADGRPLATWDESSWKVGGRLEVEGQIYEVRANRWGTRHGMADEHGTRIASADRVGRKSWTVEADGRVVEFRRAPLWRQEEELLAGGRRAGSVRQRSMWRGDAVADLPGLPVSVQIFVLAVVRTKCDTAAAAAA